MSALEPQRVSGADIERARSVPLVAMVARRVKLKRSGSGWSGRCPFHDEKTPSFTVSDARGFYHCFGCGAHGSAIDWVMEVEGCGFRDAVTRLLGGELAAASRPVAARREKLEQPSVTVSSMTAARWIWAHSGPARGEIVETYLRSRGLDPMAEASPGVAMIDALHFHPRCPLGVWRVGDHPEDTRTAPAMVAPIRDADGANWGVHVTYLAPDGRSKAKFAPVGGKERPTRKMFGKVAGFGVFLTPVDREPSVEPSERFDPGEPLIVGEGIETVWAFVERFPRACRAVATLSLQNLQGRARKLRDGSLPLWRPEADPEGPPFVGSPGLPLGSLREVIILVDADMKPLRQQKVQAGRGTRPIVADISGIQRAELCAALAAQAWRRAGAAKVTCVRPHMGNDFNDEVRSAA